MPWELTKNQNSPCSEVSSSLTVCNNKLFPDQDCDVWQKVAFIWQLVTTSSVTGTIKSSKAIPKAKLASKKVMVTVWWSPAHMIHFSFLNPSKTIISQKYAQQINEMHWKLQCLQPAPINRKGPILHDNIQPHITQPTLQKLNKSCYKVLPHWPYSPDLSPTDCHFFKHLDNFLQGNTSTTNRRQKMLSKNSLKPKAWIFMLQK